MPAQDSIVLPFYPVKGIQTSVLISCFINVFIVHFYFQLCYHTLKEAECGKHSAEQLAWMGISLLS